MRAGGREGVMAGGKEGNNAVPRSGSVRAGFLISLIKLLIIYAPRIFMST
jgi:hypothetical protein